jgi:hypothetical protein
MTTRWPFIISTMLYGLLTACMHGQMAGLPTPAPTEPVGELVVIRTSSLVGATNSFLITIDGRRAWGLRVGEYARVKIGVGAHRVGVECFGGWAPIWRESGAAELRLAPERTSYLLVAPDLTCASIKAITEEEGRDWISRSKPSAQE